MYFQFHTPLSMDPGRDQGVKCNVYNGLCILLLGIRYGHSNVGMDPNVSISLVHKGLGIGQTLWMHRLDK